MSTYFVGVVVLFSHPRRMHNTIRDKLSSFELNGDVHVAFRGGWSSAWGKISGRCVM